MDVKLSVLHCKREDDGLSGSGHISSNKSAALNEDCWDCGTINASLMPEYATPKIPFSGGSQVYPFTLFSMIANMAFGIVTIISSFTFADKLPS